MIDVFVCDAFNGAGVPNAQPSDPLPPFPMSEPGTPAPPYEADISTQPFSPEALSIADPGTHTQRPANVPDHLTSNLETEVLITLNVKY